MPTYYCHPCANRKKLLSGAIPSDLLATDYQRAHFQKHTAPDKTYPLNSIFADPTLESYRGFVVSAAASGCVQVDERGRTNAFWVAAEPPGVTYENGRFEVSANAVIVVRRHDQDTVHAYPVHIPELPTQRCA